MTIQLNQNFKSWSFIRTQVKNPLYKESAFFRGPKRFVTLTNKIARRKPLQLAVIPASLIH